MMGYIVYFQVVQSRDIIRSSYNARQDSYADRVVRGDIVDRNGNVLAHSEVQADGSEVREYPYGRLFAHVVGYSDQGKAGLESEMNFELLTSNAFFLEKIKNEFQDKKNMGDSVVTTLNLELQEAAYDALGNYKGAVVVMEPSTGKILAMVSKPDFDLNTVAENWDFLNTDQDSVLLNRATQGQYAPGSTFKVVTALEYMRENKNTYDDFSYTCSGSDYEEGGTTIPCADGNVHKTETLVKAFANSCNSAFSHIGAGLDNASFRELCNTFLFNRNIPVAFEYNKSSFVLNKESGISESQETAIGQGKTMISPLHNLMIASTVANGGKMMTPYVVDYIEDAYGRIVKQYKPSVIEQLMSAEEAEYLTECMEEVIDSGTGSSMRWSSYNAAGKTGSAQYDSSDNIHSWFVGFAPAENPQIAISVVLEGGYSGSSAQYTAKAVFDAFFV